MKVETQNELDFCPHCHCKKRNALDILSHTTSCPYSPIDVWISHYCREMNICSDGVLTNVVNTAKIRTPADIYTLSVKDIGEANPSIRLGDAMDIIKNIERSRNYDMCQILYAIDPDVFPTYIIHDLECPFGSIWDISNANVEILAQVIGNPIAAEEIKLFFERPEILDMFIEMDAAGVRLGIEDAPQKLVGTLKDKNVVFTGTLSRMPRRSAHSAVVNRGGYPQDTLTRTTDILVCGSKVGVSRTKLAKRYGTQIISEEEFTQMLLDSKLIVRRTK